MKHIYIILPLIVSFLLAGCGIKRDNPLDPHSSSILEPAYVTGLTLLSQGSGSDTRIINITWNSNSAANTDGYFVNRSMGYNNAYAIIDTVWHVDQVPVQSYIHSSANDPSVAPSEYWYKVSAFKDYPAGRLEGRRSEPKPVIVRP